MSASRPVEHAQEPRQRIGPAPSANAVTPGTPGGGHVMKAIVQGDTVRRSRCSSWATWIDLRWAPPRCWSGCEPPA
jgi:hypothetical protein